MPAAAEAPERDRDEGEGLKKACAPPSHESLEIVPPAFLRDVVCRHTILLARCVTLRILQLTMPLPPARGLYDPSLERDACGLGFVADLRRPPSHDVVSKGIEILRRLAHRGAAGCDPCTGDGAGILLHIPHTHYERTLARSRVELPNAGDYGVGQCFLSRDSRARAAEVRIIEDAIRHHNQKVIGWRDVPIDPSVLGPIARSSMPVFRQVFIGRMCPVPAFERTLFMIRKRACSRAT
jgi:glutamate synthase domain-containing protein 1